MNGLRRALGPIIDRLALAIVHDNASSMWDGDAGYFTRIDLLDRQHYSDPR